MSQPIFQLWMARYTPAWYALSQDARQELMAKNGKVTAEAGGETLFAYQTLWSSERWTAFGVNRFPDAAAVSRNAFGLYSINWFNFIDSQVFLGTVSEGTAYQPPLPGDGNAVYKLFVTRGNASGHAAPPEVIQGVMGKAAELRQKMNVRVLLNCDCMWSSEPWLFFGIEQFGCLEDEQAYAMHLPATGMFQYSEGFTLLGMELPSTETL